MCVATAASMDGYTAFGASITAEGAKQTFSCPAPLAVLADTNIIRKAPGIMTASGYADLFAKVTAGADWILADWMGVEKIDETAWSIVQDGLHFSPGETESQADDDRHQRIGHADIPDNRPRPGIGAGRVGKGLPKRLQRQAGWPHHEVEQQRGDNQQRQQQQHDGAAAHNVTVVCHYVTAIDAERDDIGFRRETHG